VAFITYKSYKAYGNYLLTDLRFLPGSPAWKYVSKSLLHSSFLLVLVEGRLSQETQGQEGGKYRIFLLSPLCVK
jgi:hypothetical protein